MRFILCLIGMFFCFATVFGAEKTFDAAKVSELRAAKKYVEAERMLKPYASPAKFETLGASQKVEFLNGLLELAHVRAMKGDVAGALALLNWAEDRSEPYFRAVACVKYAEILSELEEYERARAYLKNADAIINPKLKGSDSGTAIGQGGKTADTVATWRELAERSLLLSSNLEYGELQKKFGATYAAYVKLRRIQRRGNVRGGTSSAQKSLELADEIIAQAPDSVFAAAAKYLKGEIMASHLTEDSPTREIAAVKDSLLKLTKDRKTALYRGEALMLLGKISLEIEWNAKDAEKYYSAALAHFREARARRDALSLYAPMNDDLKRQTAPTQKPTTLNQWKRIVYHDEDPLKLYNNASAPVWYIDDKEKNCVYVLGFLAFADGKNDVAKSYWEKILSLSPDVAALDQRLPNIQTRLLKACHQNGLLLWPEDKARVGDRLLMLKLSYAEFLILLEKFDDGISALQRIEKTAMTSEMKIIVLFLIGVSLENSERKDRENAERYFSNILGNEKFRKYPIYGRTLFYMGYKMLGGAGKEQKAVAIFQEYLTLFPEGRDSTRAIYYMGFSYCQMGNWGNAMECQRKLENKKSEYAKILAQDIIQQKEERGK